MTSLRECAEERVNINLPLLHHQLSPLTRDRYTDLVLDLALPHHPLLSPLYGCRIFHHHLREVSLPLPICLPQRQDLRRSNSILVLAMIEAGQERVEASDNDSNHRKYRPHSLHSITISFINLCYYLEYLASKRLASHYTPVLYFFAIFICITKEIFFGSGDRATFLHHHYTLWRRRRRCSFWCLFLAWRRYYRGLCVLHMYMSELCF